MLNTYSIQVSRIRLLLFDLLCIIFTFYIAFQKYKLKVKKLVLWGWYLRISHDLDVRDLTFWVTYHVIRINIWLFISISIHFQYLEIVFHSQKSHHFMTHVRLLKCVYTESDYQISISKDTQSAPLLFTCVLSQHVCLQNIISTGCKIDLFNKYKSAIPAGCM